MNEMNPLPTEEKISAENAVQAKKMALRMAAILMGGASMAAVFYFFIAWQLGAWQMYALAVDLALFTPVAFMAIRKIRSDHVETGGWMLIIGMLVVFSASVLLVSNVGLIFGLILIVLTFVTADQTLTISGRRQALFASIGVGIMMVLADRLPLDYRILVPQLQAFAPTLAVVMLLVLGFFVLRQSWEVINRSLRLKIILWSGIGFFISAAFIIGYAAITLRSVASRSAEAGALDAAHAQAAEIQTVLERTLSAGEIFTDSVIVGKTEGIQLSREQVNAMLRQVLKDNPQFVGVDVLFEPNAFDGRDAEFVNTEGSDANGRFLPYWTRGEGGKIQVELLQDYDVSDWYQCPKLTKVPCLIDPYVYPVQGQDVWMTSLVIPFVYEDTFLGITGIDTPVTFLQDLADSVDIFDGAGEVAIVSNNGTLLGVTGQPDLIGQPVTAMHKHFSTDDYKMIKYGVETLRYSPGNEDLEVFVPVQVGETDSPWAVNVIIPRTAILAGATRQMWQMIGIGGGLLVISLIILSYATGQVTRPIEKVTDVARQVTAGNLDVVADVEVADETGILAGAFNTMVSQLRDTLATMEDRIEERTSSLELAAQVGRTISQVSKLDSMLRQATQLILDQFDLYYVQVYLTDPGQTTLKLEAGTGEVGVQLLSRNHSLPLSTASINGRAAVEKRAVVISDTTESLTFRPNPLLPDTRGEMALPLIVGEKVVGVLDLQTRYSGKLTDEQVPAYEALAGQLAVAIQNANLLAEAEQARAEVEAQARRQVRVNWNEHLDAIHKPEQVGYVFDHNQVLPLEDANELPDESQSVSAPISLTGEELGALVVEIDDETRKEQTSELVAIVARQVAQQIENLRLLESAERYRQEAELAVRRQTQEGWQEYIRTKSGETLGYLYDLNEVRPHNNGHDDVSALILPLKVREETVGKLAIHGLTGEDKEALELVSVVAERLGNHIESLRLTQQIQLRAHREQALRQITNAVRSSTNLTTIMRTAVRELGTVMGRRAVIRMAVPDVSIDENAAPEQTEPSENADGGMNE